MERGLNELVKMEHNMSAVLYNLLLKNDNHHLKRMKGVDGNFLSAFPVTRKAFWSLQNSDVRQLLDEMGIDYSYCTTDEDFLQELGMHIGVQPKNYQLG